MQADGRVVRWVVGPPAPYAVRWLARGLSVTAFVLVVYWVQDHLGGVAFQPTPLPGGKNNTDQLFNWHPIFMTLAFVVLMSEAVLAYRAPWSARFSWRTRKTVHWMLHAVAAVCITLALVAAFQSHNLKQPPIPNLYSPHSYLGLTTVALASLQIIAGFYSYLFPKLPLEHRMALVPVHRYLGQATYVLGLATIAVGLQEKSAFLQFGKELTTEQLFSGIIRLPAALEVLVALTGFLVLYHHAPAAKPAVDKDPYASEDMPLGQQAGRPSAA